MNTLDDEHENDLRGMLGITKNKFYLRCEFK